MHFRRELLHLLAWFAFTQSCIIYANPSLVCVCLETRACANKKRHVGVFHEIQYSPPWGPGRRQTMGVNFEWNALYFEISHRSRLSREFSNTKGTIQSSYIQLMNHSQPQTLKKTHRAGDNEVWKSVSLQIDRNRRAWTEPNWTNAQASPSVQHSSAQTITLITKGKFFSAAAY